MKLTSSQLKVLVELYCDRFIDDMSYKDLGQTMFDIMVNSYEKYSYEELESTILSNYDEEFLEELLDQIIESN